MKDHNDLLLVSSLPEHNVTVAERENFRGGLSRSNVSNCQAAPTLDDVTVPDFIVITCPGCNMHDVVPRSS